MTIVEDLVHEHPWHTIAGAFLVGAALGIDRRARRSLALTGLQLVRAIAVERAKQYVRRYAAETAEPAYARA